MTTLTALLATIEPRYFDDNPWPALRTFVLYGGGVITLGSMIFVGTRLSQDGWLPALPGIAGAFFGITLVLCSRWASDSTMGNATNAVEIVQSVLFILVAVVLVSALVHLSQRLF